jgi:RimJ/RimL family protein N-acetyltransferase
MIYQTKRLLIRKLKSSDINPFHKMQGNKNVMRYTDGIAKTFDEDVVDLKRVIDYYNKPNNDFWVWAVERKKDNVFLGTIALIKDDNSNDEIGYRFLEKYWNNGYAYESMMGLIDYCKSKGLKEIVAEVIVKNKASEHIIKKAGFQLVKEYLCEDLKLLERMYKLKL